MTSFNEELYVIAGFDDSYQEVVLYKPFINTVQPVINGAVNIMETGRANHCAVILEDLIYVITDQDGHSCLKSVEL